MYVIYPVGLLNELKSIASSFNITTRYTPLYLELSSHCQWSLQLYKVLVSSDRHCTRTGLCSAEDATSTTALCIPSRCRRPPSNTRNQTSVSLLSRVDLIVVSPLPSGDLWGTSLPLVRQLPSIWPTASHSFRVTD